MQTTEQRAAAVGNVLVDIREVSVSKELSREERISEFIRQIKDPYCFKCGRFTVRASFGGGRRNFGGTALRGSFAEQKISEKGLTFPFSDV